MQLRSQPHEDRKKRDALFDAGADYVVATEEDLVARVMDITNGKGADVVYDAVAGGLSEQLVQATKVRGHWIVYGFLDETQERISLVGCYNSKRAVPSLQSI